MKYNCVLNKKYRFFYFVRINISHCENIVRIIISFVEKIAFEKNQDNTNTVNKIPNVFLYY